MGIKHHLITGVTESGKTTLAREIARQISAAKQRVIVYDPMGTATAGGNWPNDAIIFNDDFDFLDYVAKPDVCKAHVFIDEADEIFNLQSRENFWILKAGKHFGFCCYVITQRPKMVAPTIRGQCGICYMFRLAADDQREIGRDFGHSGLESINLDTGDYIKLVSGSRELSRGNIFDQLSKREAK